ncbi:MAG: hypothetical protein ACJ763_19510 [Bdellovibrionia bacterium]
MKTKAQYTILGLATLLSFAANATGYYNFGMHWKGAPNPHFIGGAVTFQSGFTAGASTGGAASNDTGGFNQPTSVAFDWAGNLYVSDYINSRINKYTAAGAFVSSISLTFQPRGISLDPSGNLYIANMSDSAIVKYDSSGVYQGWIGNIATSPTGGAAGCNGAAAGTFTPGWCKGGSSTSGTGDGMLDSPTALVVDSAGKMYVMDSHNGRISKYTTAGAFIGWTGYIQTSPTGGAAGCNGATGATPGWCTGGTALNGVGAGAGFFSPWEIAEDNFGNLYVADRGNHRVVKYNSSGVYQGWIGGIISKPTGGAAGCSTSNPGTITPGWCTGGAADSGTASGFMYTPHGIVADSAGNIYVSNENNYRINKYNSSGAFQGWMGTIATSPTGGAAGCSGAAAGTDTPGWCTGGTASPGIVGVGALAIDSSDQLFVADQVVNWVLKISSSGVVSGTLKSIATYSTGWKRILLSASGTGDGLLYSPQGMAVDSAKNIYVLDAGNHRISKYNASGAFVGWIGKISTQPTGGAAGCSSASVGTFTPGWCTGGDADFGTGDGMLNGGNAIALDPSGNMYVVDGNHRVSKYNSAGAFVGWIGKISTQPTGGAAGCSSASVGTFTPGWCTGGTSTSGAGDGMLSSPGGVALDSSGNIYVADYGNNRISKYNSAGAFVGWIGKISTQPTGGAAGCSSAAVGSFTPGWCTGGVSASGSGDGMMSSPRNIALDSSGNFYVSDIGNNRLEKFASTGAFLGWIGKIGTVPTGGVAGCTGASVGAATPGWCTGGASAAGSGDGMYPSVLGLTVSTQGGLYVSLGSNRITKADSVTGAFQGWIGLISGSPSGGETGCKGAAVGTVTPGWCIGGATAVSGSGDGVLKTPKGLARDSAGNLYVVDSGNHRIIRFTGLNR